MQPEKLETVTRATFLKLQECWQARAYEPMQPLLMRDLYQNHCKQLASLTRNHEVNMIADLKVEHVDIVNLRYTNKPEQREFTALITASAKDYYLDDRTQKFLRGDEAAAEFQEFWTFHRQGEADLVSCNAGCGQWIDGDGGASTLGLGTKRCTSILYTDQRIGK